jgi:hypothetical protein
MSHDLRCTSGKKFGEVINDHTVEIKCASPGCGAVPGQVVVIHRFDLLEGTVTTRKFKQPQPSRKK